MAFAEGTIVMVHAIRTTANNEPTRDFAVGILGNAFMPIRAASNMPM
jgi:hypothetical protein